MKNKDISKCENIETTFTVKRRKFKKMVYSKNLFVKINKGRKNVALENSQYTLPKVIGEGCLYFEIPPPKTKRLLTRNMYIPTMYMCCTYQF